MIPLQHRMVTGGGYPCGKHMRMCKLAESLCCTSGTNVTSCCQPYSDFTSEKKKSNHNILPRGLTQAMPSPWPGSFQVVHLS